LEHVNVRRKLLLTRIATISCYISLALSLVSFITDITGRSIDYALFGRSGSIMVLCGVFLEYQIGSTIALWNNLTGNAFKHKDVKLLDKKTSESPRIRMTAHIFVISGTLIWGFGSLLQNVV